MGGGIDGFWPSSSCGGQAVNIQMNDLSIPISQPGSMRARTTTKRQLSARAGFRLIMPTAFGSIARGGGALYPVPLLELSPRLRHPKLQFRSFFDPWNHPAGIPHFNEQARVFCQRRGLMQILASTGPTSAGQSITRYSSKEALPAETNHYSRLDISASYDSALRKAGLPAYNAGASRVDRWLRNSVNVDMPEFRRADSISAETEAILGQVIA